MLRSLMRWTRRAKIVLLMKKLILLVCVVLSFSGEGQGQTKAIVDNGVIRREISLDSPGSGIWFQEMDKIGRTIGKPVGIHGIVQ